MMSAAVERKNIKSPLSVSLPLSTISILSKSSIEMYKICKISCPTPRKESGNCTDLKLSNRDRISKGVSQFHPSLVFCKCLGRKHFGSLVKSRPKETGLSHPISSVVEWRLESMAPWSKPRTTNSVLSFPFYIFPRQTSKIRLFSYSVIMGMAEKFLLSEL